MNQHESRQVTEQTGASAGTPPSFQEKPDPDFEFEIQTRLGGLARHAAGLSGGDRLARALTELQGALADCDIAPIDEVPTLTPIQDLVGTAGAGRSTAGSLDLPPGKML